eukprot:scaffold4940_cov55-Cyclotella_meneghiniana.AAC.4
MVRTLSYSSITFASDLDVPFQSESTSGVLYGTKESVDDSTGMHITTLFVWVASSVHLRSTVDHLCNEFGYADESLIFLPYSNKQKWIKNYSIAIPSMECDSHGNVIPFGGTASAFVFRNTDSEELRTLTPFNIMCERRKKVARQFSRDEWDIYNYVNLGVPPTETEDSVEIMMHPYPYLCDGESVQGSRIVDLARRRHTFTRSTTGTNESPKM